MFTNLYIDFFLMCLAFCFAVALIKYCNGKLASQEDSERDVEKIDPPPSYDEIMKLERKCLTVTATSPSSSTTD